MTESEIEQHYINHFGMGDDPKLGYGDKKMIEWASALISSQPAPQNLPASEVSYLREELIAFANYCEREWNCTEVPPDVIDEYLAGK